MIEINKLAEEPFTLLEEETENEINEIFEGNRIRPKDATSQEKTAYDIFSAGG